jgi:hypothetical protein
MAAPGSPLTNSELADGELLRNQSGIPHYAVGRLTVTFVIETARGRRAVRVFHRPVLHATQRYQHVVSALQVTRHPQIAWYRYMPDGIELPGGVYPVAVRPWIEGVNLNQALSLDRSKPNIRRIRESLTRIATHLQASGLAHGNIHHGNLIFSGDDELVLVDPECMYTPRIRSLGPVIPAHRNYGGNLARQVYGLQLDAIPVSVIHMGLNLLSEKAHQWFTFDSGDNVLLSEHDLENPAKSELLTQSDRGRMGIDYFIRNLTRPTWSVDHWHRRSLEIDRHATVFGALDVDSAATNISNDVTIVGRVFKAVPYSPAAGRARLFLNFGHHRDGAVTVVPDYAARATVREAASQFDRQWIYARGELRHSGSMPTRNGTERIDLHVTKPTNIRVISVSDAARLMRGS